MATPAIRSPCRRARDPRPEAEVDAAPRRQLGEALRELEAVAGLVAGQAQAADELLAHLRERGLVADATVAVEQLEGNAALAQDRDVARAAVELLLGAKQLQRAAHALVVGDAGGGAQRAQAVAAVLGEPHHAALLMA